MGRSGTHRVLYTFLGKESAESRMGEVFQRIAHREQSPTPHGGHDFVEGVDAPESRVDQSLPVATPMWSASETSFK